MQTYLTILGRAVGDHADKGLNFIPLQLVSIPFLANYVEDARCHSHRLALSCAL
jgi:hypothetical protein